MSERPDEPLTLMAVHAHPDDECFGTGGVLIKYASEGVRTVLVTATKGEEGEIHDPDLTEEEARPRLAEIREEELRRATALLKVGVQEFLGYRDSGMVGTPANDHPESFNKADLDEATGRLVRLIRRYRPQVLVTYNEDGGYGHPDHLQCHRVTARAFDAAGDAAQYPEAGPAWQPLKLYATAWSRERWLALRAAMRERGIEWPFGRDQDEEQGGEGAQGAPEHRDESEVQQAVAIAANTEDAAHEPPFDERDAATAVGEATGAPAEQSDEEEAWGQPEETITTFVDVSDYWWAPREALRQHRTQFAPDTPFLNLPDDLAMMTRTTEFFVLLRSLVETTRPEDDLFAGIRAGAPATTAREEPAVPTPADA